MKASALISPSRSAEHGFTLVEMLVSLLIFGMLSAAGVALLSFSALSQEAADAQLGHVAEIGRAGALMAADFAQAAPRLSRDEAGSAQPAFRGAEADVALVRRGWENFNGAPRASLQKIEYRIAEGALQRLHYPYVDGAEPAPPVTLLDGVERMSIRYRDDRGEWRGRWDPADAAELPRAVELTLVTDHNGTIRQLFLVGAGA